MTQTKAGGKLAAQTIKEKYGSNYYALIGAKGGANGNTGGFGAGENGRLLAMRAGRLGGLKSRRRPK